MIETGPRCITSAQNSQSLNRIRTCVTQQLSTSCDNSQKLSCAVLCMLLAWPALTRGICCAQRPSMRDAYSPRSLVLGRVRRDKRSIPHSWAVEAVIDTSLFFSITRDGRVQQAGEVVRSKKQWNAITGIVSAPPPLSSWYPKGCSAAARLELFSRYPHRPGRYVLRYTVPGYLAFGCPRSPAHLAGMDAFRNESKASTLDLRHHSVQLAARPSSNNPHQSTS